MSNKMCGNCGHAEYRSLLTDDGKVPCHLHGRMADFNMRCQEWIRFAYGKYARSKSGIDKEQLHLFYLNTDSNTVARYSSEVEVAL